jgi:hypothetical protein
MLKDITNHYQDQISRNPINYPGRSKLSAMPNNSERPKKNQQKRKPAKKAKIS